MSSEELRHTIQNTALHLLGRREYSVQSLTEKLRQKFPDSVDLVGQVVADFSAREYVSDTRFAELYIREKSQFTGWGKRKIFQKLSEKGIETELAQAEWDRQNSDAVTRIRAKELAQQKWDLLTKKEPDTWKRQQKVLAYLAQRGFEYEICSSVIQDIKKSL